MPDPSPKPEPLSYQRLLEITSGMGDGQVYILRFLDSNDRKVRSRLAELEADHREITRQRVALESDREKLESSRLALERCQAQYRDAVKRHKTRVAEEHNRLHAHAAKQRLIEKVLTKVLEKLREVSEQQPCAEGYVCNRLTEAVDRLADAIENSAASCRLLIDAIHTEQQRGD